MSCFLGITHNVTTQVSCLPIVDMPYVANTIVWHVCLFLHSACTCLVCLRAHMSPGLHMSRHKFLACLSSTCQRYRLSRVFVFTLECSCCDSLGSAHVVRVAQVTTQVSCLPIVDMLHTLPTLSCVARVCFYDRNVYVVFPWERTCRPGCTWHV